MHLLENMDISHLSNFKTQASTKYYFEVNTLDDVANIFEIRQFCDQKNIPFLIVWWGTNMLFAFDMFPWVIIKNNLTWYVYNEEEKTLQVFTQQKIWDVAFDLEYKYNNSLWHRFIGLPGTIGGAVFGNAGCFGLETQSHFVKVDVLNLETGAFETLWEEEVQFAYRDSIFKQTQKYFLIQAYFDISSLQEKYASEVDNIKFREEVQPKWNSCGSFFKNPNKEFSAGKLIEAVGLKWYVYNNAYFSQKHANFLMTMDEKWDYKDLLFLIDLAQKKVWEQFQIQLEPEVRIITK